MSAHDDQWRARVVADSVSPAGSRVTTIEARIHRFVLAELNTHRAFSRNSASSRAIPVAKMIRSVETDPALPEEFGTAKAGMQAGPPVENEMEALTAWLSARDAAVQAARTLAELGVHKQVTNRLLEPFQWHTVIVTATYWDGFWLQRCSDLAQPEIRVAAQAMRAAYDASATEGGRRRGVAPALPPGGRGRASTRTWPSRVCAARCARVSYLTQNGVRSIDEDLTLYERLVTATPPHASPLEHVATPATSDSGPQGNLAGWVQLRHLVLV